MTAIIERLVAFAERLPPWLRPAFFGAVILFAIVGVRMLFRLPAIVQRPEQWGEFALGLLGAAGAGAIGGLGYTLLGVPARRIPLIGAYICGVITIAAYMVGALVLFTIIIPDDPLIKDRTDLMIYGGVTIFFGLLAGFFWFREDAHRI
ncbi:MAG: hypothetical protein Q8Q14_07075 [Gemmatimonadales bacterium]|nr:hypothetical protein [Gemmatimonadales bacterium]